MLPFPIQLVPGQPVYEQIVHAVKRALLTGHLKPGSRFPPIRAIALELGINPNTVLKAISVLTNANILEVHSGHGCFVAAHLPSSDRRMKLKILDPLVEQLLVEASSLGLSEEDLITYLRTQTQKLKRT